MTRGETVQITSIEPIAVSLPMRKPVIMAGEEIRRADNLLVRIETGSGLVGWGEAGAAPLHTGETVPGMAAAVHYLAPALLGREAADIGGALAAMDGRMYANHGAKAAVEIALHDLTGKAADKPVHALLGGKRRSRMALLGVVGGGDFDGDVKDVAAKKAAGVTAYKIKVGVDTPQSDAARTRAICQALGGGLLISADANQGYTVAQAIDYVRALQGCGLAFFEQPVMAHDHPGKAEVAAAAGALAIGTAEGIHSRDDISRHHEMMAARGVCLKAIKLGGLRALTEAGRLCDRLGMSVNVSCKTGESSIACAAALHVAAVIPAIAWGLTLTNLSLAQDVTAHPVRMDRGFAAVLDRPGLGIDVDEDRVRHHRNGATLQMA
jgi:muconate cycloisomerase